LIRWTNSWTNLSTSGTNSSGLEPSRHGTKGVGPTRSFGLWSRRSRVRVSSLTLRKWLQNWPLCLRYRKDKRNPWTNHGPISGRRRGLDHWPVIQGRGRWAAYVLVFGDSHHADQCAKHSPAGPGCGRERRRPSRPHVDVPCPVVIARIDLPSRVLAGSYSALPRPSAACGLFGFAAPVRT
jgi:hypothetical protein